MSLTSIRIALQRRAWIPLVCTALATLAVGVLTIRSQPTYTATATVIAKNPENATDRPLSFPEVVTSNTVASHALQSAKVREPVDRFEASLSVVSGKSDIYQIAVKDADPARATTLANAVADESTAYYQDLAGGDTVSIQATIDKDRADLNSRYLEASQALLAFNQTNPQPAGGREDSKIGAQRLQLQLSQQAAANAVLNFEAGITQGKLGQITTIRNFEAHVLDRAVPTATGGRKPLLVAYAGALGLIAGIIAALLLDYFGRSINQPEDAEAYLGAAVVGVIPRASPRKLRREAAAK
ncbi:MAG: Wzz/FepE/Etk N-terminal domain-containing protein [Candidatus Dormibacter sp.]